MLTALVIQRLQYRHISLSWHTGLLYGLPFLPAVLMIFSFVAFVASLFFLPAKFLVQDGLAFANTVITFMISWFFVEKLVTSDHIITFPFFSFGKIPIQSIADYYVSTVGLISKVTVIYNHASGKKKKTIILPARYLKLFDHLLDAQLKPNKNTAVSKWFINKEN